MNNVRDALSLFGVAFERLYILFNIFALVSSVYVSMYEFISSVYAYLYRVLLYELLGVPAINGISMRL